MAQGFEVYNDSGTLVADSNTPVLALTHSGVLTVTTLLAGSYYLDTIHITDGIAPIFAVGAASTNSYDVHPTWGGSGTNDFTWQIGCTGSGNTFHWYIFDYQSVPATTIGGIECYDTTGARTFSSASKPLRIVEFINGPYTAILGDRTYTAGRSYAAVPVTQACYHSTYSPDDGVTINTGYGVTNGYGVTAFSITNGVHFANIAVQQTGNAGNTANCQIIVLDVTNY